MEAEPERISRTYLFVVAAFAPVIRWWGRLEVRRRRASPDVRPGAAVGNHDSLWDPIAIGTAGRRRRQIRALAKASLWKIRPLAPILDRMGQIPIERGAGDAGALDAAVAALRGGSCIGVFPEGTISRGTELRASSGVGRLAQQVPEARIVCVATDRHGRHLQVPEAPAHRDRVLRPGRRPAAPRRGPGSPLGPLSGGDPREGPDRQGRQGLNALDLYGFAGTCGSPSP